jgi:hypothetical protein
MLIVNIVEYASREKTALAEIGSISENSSSRSQCRSQRFQDFSTGFMVEEPDNCINDWKECNMVASITRPMKRESIAISRSKGIGP